MSSSIFFQGALTHIPGSYAEADVSALQRVGFGSTGIVACLGEAVGGSPYNAAVAADRIHNITNPAKVGKTFRSGDLLEAGAFLFDPSKDPDIPGGAQQVRFVKVNPATQSSVILPNAGGNAVTIESLDYGLFTTQISIEVADGTTQGKAITVVFETTTETFDDVGGDDIFTALYTPGANGATTMTMAVAPLVGVTAAWTKTRTGLAADYDGQIGSIVGEDDEKAANIVAGNVVSVISTSAADTTQSVTVYGINNATGLPASEVLLLTGLVEVVGATTWTSVRGFILSAACAGNVTVRDNGAGDNPLFTILAGQTVNGGGTQVFSQLENAGSQLTLVADGATVQTVIIVGTSEADVAQAEAIALTGAVPVTTALRWNRVDVLALGYVEAARTLTMSGLLLNVGDTVSVVGQAGDTASIIIYGRSAAGAAQTETLVLNGATPVAGTATWSKVLGVALSALSAGTVTVSASTQGVTIFSFNGAASRYAGVGIAANLNMEGGIVSVVSSAAGDTYEHILVIGTTTAGAAQVELLALNGATTVNGTAQWGSITGFAVGHVPGASTLTFSGSIVAAVATYDTVQKVIDLFNANGGWTLTAVVANPATFNISDMDLTSATSVLSATVGYEANLWAFIEAINEGSQLVSAERAAPGTGAPSNTAAPVFLAGGIEGATSFADWQAAIDLLREEEVNTIVVLTDDAAVHAAVVSHCVYMAGAGRNERDAVLGEASSETLANLKTAALALNTRHASLVVQDCDRFNSAGVRETFPPYFTACLAAGMESAVSPGVPTTARFINLLDTANDSSFTVIDDGDDLIQSGLMVIEKVPNRGFRWLRSITTHLIDDNVAYVERSTNKAVNFAIKEFRRRMEVFVGKPGFAGTLNAIKAAALQVLGELIALNVITAWQNLTLELAADVVDVDVEIAPIVPVNFIHSTLHLVPTQLSVAA